MSITTAQSAEEQIRYVEDFQNLVSTVFQDKINAVCWKRKLVGNYKEIIDKISLNENITSLEEDELLALELSEDGQLAREIILADLKLLKDYGASPVLNVIQNYDRDEENPIFPTDVYSFHVDQSPVPTDTFLCTYYGDASEIIPNSQATQKILIPEVLSDLRKLYNGNDEEFEDFLIEHFYDLHYQPNSGAIPTNLKQGNLWRLTVKYPGMKYLPCIHRAPIENSGKKRLLLIC